MYGIKWHVVTFGIDLSACVVNRSVPTMRYAYMSLVIFRIRSKFVHYNHSALSYVCELEICPVCSHFLSAATDMLTTNKSLFLALISKTVAHILS